MRTTHQEMGRNVEKGERSINTFGNDEIIGNEVKEIYENTEILLNLNIGAK